MNTRERIVAYIEELATRNALIAHSPATRESRRFFQWGTNDAALMANFALNNTGWNLLLDVIEGNNVDNRHDYEARVKRVALLFIKHCKPQDIIEQNATINAAETLGWKFLKRMRKHAQNRCQAVTDGEVSTEVIIPTVVEWPTIKDFEVSPLMFVGDEHYGYRFEVSLKYDVLLIEAEVPGDWITP
jgi:hypothetical protein